MTNLPIIAVLFLDFGPYHVARIDALATAASKIGGTVIGVRFQEKSATYSWLPCEPRVAESHTLLPGSGRVRTGAVVMAWLRFLKRARVDIAFLPSYWPLANALCLIAARLVGVRCFMMNESWAATEKARVLGRFVKRMFLRLFDGALVGGSRQKEHFVSLGVPGGRIATGYDVVDNAFFAAGSDTVRAAGVRPPGLPGRYILNVGRMVPKKNLGILIEAYALLARENPGLTHSLVLVGDGPCRDALIKQARDAGLPVFERGPENAADGPPSAPSVVIFPFAQLDDLPGFYAFASVFVLPSTAEEWGLVVNEAMASGLPVVVTRNAGCVPELVVENVNGFTFDPANAAQLSEILSRFTGSPEVEKLMGAASQKIIRQYGPDRFAAEALKLIAL
ncbi:MAG: glycosyltransferase family 4 protein [Chthoniobacteraceae bacterium]